MVGCVLSTKYFSLKQFSQAKGLGYTACVRGGPVQTHVQMSFSEQLCMSWDFAYRRLELS